MSWDDNQHSEVSDHWETHQTVRGLEDLAETNPELARELLDEAPAASEHLKQHVESRIKRLKEKVAASGKKLKRGGAFGGDTIQQVREILNRK